MIRTIKFLIEDKKEPFYLATSMGVDSVSAAHWLISKGYSNLTLLHFNHKLRKQNDEMEIKFYEFCKEFNLKSICGAGKNINTEKECREARLKFYEEKIMQKSKIITAHHLNDCVESYLLNCLRGHPNHSIFNLFSEFTNYQIIHPFLITRKKDFIQYAERNRLKRFIVNDETNSIIKGSRRNWVRGVLIPEIKKQKICLEKYVLKEIKKEVDKKEKSNKIMQKEETKVSEKWDISSVG